MFVRESEGLSVHILNYRQPDSRFSAIKPHAAGKGHRREHICGINIIIGQQFLDAAPPGGTYQLFVLFKITMAVGIYEWGRTENGHEGNF